MQILRLLIATYLAVAFVACAPKEPTPEEMLQAGRWEINNVNNLQKDYKFPIKKSYMDFYDDGTVKTFIESTGQETGTWTLNADKSYIVIKADSGRYHDSLAFEFEDESTLHVINQGRKMEFKRTSRPEE